ncbi:MAG: amidohydrolase family protein [Myxococcales bacterium]|nr:amidohydrolase family protein [Myxococcales bacterium]
MISASVAWGQDHEPPRSVAIIHGTVHLSTGEVLKDASVVTENGRIRAIGQGVSIADDAEVIDAGGAIVTAGPIAVNAPLGLVEVELEASTVHSEPQTDDPIRASFSAVDGYDPRSVTVPVARVGGITTAVVTPTGGFIAGSGAVIDLYAPPGEEDVVRAVAGVHVNLTDAGVAAAGGAMPRALGRLREVLDDARAYGKNRAAYERRGLRPMDTGRLDLERLQDVLSGKVPLVVEVHRAVDIRRIIELAEAYRLRLVILGAAEGWLVADALAKAKVPVFIQPLTNLPALFDRLHGRYDNARLLADAGVTVGFLVGGAHDARVLMQQAGNAIAWGLDRHLALAAITTVPAEAFGVGKDYGEIALGKVANLVVWSGDPFEVTSYPTHVVIRGVSVPLESRQTALFKRYRALPAHP